MITILTTLFIVLGMLSAWNYGYSTGWIRGFEDGRRFWENTKKERK